MRVVTVMLCTVILWMVSGPPAGAGEGEEQQPASVATVNGTPVSADRFAEALRYELARLRAFGPREDPAAGAALTTRAASQALLALVQEELIRAEGQRRGLRASAFEVAARLAREEQRYASEPEFEDALLRQGLSREALARSLELRLLEQKLKRDIGTEEPTEAEAQAYYEQHPTEFVETLAGGRKGRRLPFAEVTDSIMRRLRARRREFGYLDWLRQALATAEVAVSTPEVRAVIGSDVGLSWPMEATAASLSKGLDDAGAAPEMRDAQGVDESKKATGRGQ